MWAKTLRQLLDTLQARRRHHHTATSTASSPPLSSTERSARRQAPRQDALDVFVAHAGRPILELPHIGARNLAGNAPRCSSFCARAGVADATPDRLRALPDARRARAAAENAASARSPAPSLDAPRRRGLVLQADVVATADIVETPRGDGTRGETVRVAVYRRFIRHGSLRDALHRVTDPSQPHHAKYDAPTPNGALLQRLPQRRSSGPWRMPAAAAAPPTPPTRAAASFGRRCVFELVALYGRQVLEAMTYLAGTGEARAVHVHAGNAARPSTPRGRRRRLSAEWEPRCCARRRRRSRRARPRPPAGSCEYRASSATTMASCCTVKTAAAAPLTDAARRGARAHSASASRDRPPRGRCSSASSSPPPAPPTARRSPARSPRFALAPSPLRPPRRRRRPPARARDLRRRRRPTLAAARAAPRCSHRLGPRPAEADAAPKPPRLHSRMRSNGSLPAHRRCRYAPALTRPSPLCSSMRRRRRNARRQHRRGRGGAAGGSPPACALQLVHRSAVGCDKAGAASTRDVGVGARAAAEARQSRHMRRAARRSG